MPELPEVETARRLLRRVLEGRRIEAVATVVGEVAGTVAGTGRRVAGVALDWKRNCVRT